MNPLTATRSAFDTIQASTRSRGFVATARLICLRLIEVVRGQRAANAKLCRELVSGKAGLEIGGPSEIFSRDGLLPIYAHAARMDNCNFATETIWEGELQEGESFRPECDRTMGTQFVREATDLLDIPSEAYDFICSCHTLEHVANPLGALKEWMRVMRPGGTLALVLPHKEATFDHRRPVTALDHFKRDKEMRVAEDDLTHLEEILSLHDLSRDPGAGDFESFEQRSRENFTNRCLHHHVFDTELAVSMVVEAGLRVIAADRASPIDIVVLCTKVADQESS